MSIKIRPLHDRVVIRRLDEDNTTAGGIVIPDNAAEKPIKGEIIAIGSGKPLDNGEIRSLDVAVGDTVIFGKFAGTEVKLDGSDYVVMREEDIMGVLSA
jgi:chaperonin GroES